MAGKPELLLAYQNGALDFADYLIRNPCVLDLLKSKNPAKPDEEETIAAELEQMFEKWYEGVVPLFIIKGVL